MNEKLTIKDSLNLPDTDFRMKANLAESEPQQIEAWNEDNIYEEIRQSRKGEEIFYLHDGPPYANGHTHIGTALNKILKDFVVRSRMMKGYDCPYLPGWDCHGLPIELKVEEKLGDKKEDLTTSQFRRKCREHAEKYIDAQREEFRRLGIFGEWDEPYITMSTNYEATIIEALKNFYTQGHVFQGLKPVHWCISCETALAEAEVEYKPHRSPSIFVKFPVVDFFDKEIEAEDTYVVIWTTTPWTLPSNLAIAFHPDLDYVALKKDGSVYIVAAGLTGEFKRNTGLEGAEVVSRFKGKKVEGGACRHPFIDRRSQLVIADYVSLEQGTGCVHTAPGHGHEDFVTGQKYGIDIYAPVDDQGKFTSDVEQFAGMNVFEANEPICDVIEENGTLLKKEELEHSYPHCWRCDNPLVFRATKQWFIDMDCNNLREKAKKGIKETGWKPEWGEERILKMVEERPDWCISRQRSWGVPITVFLCSDCGEPFASEESFDRVIEVFSEEGSDSWYEKNVEAFLPEGVCCSECGGGDFEKETDILDVWFESGSSHLAVRKGRSDHELPCDVYLEGTDQYRGWFQSSLLVGLANIDSPPFKNVITHGFVVDEDGMKMSKSAGNVISPLDITGEYGAEILRLWAAMTEYTGEMKLSWEMLDRNAESYRKIRNTFRFLLGNLSDYQEQSFSGKDLVGVDRWALHKLHKLEKELTEAYENYQFHRIYHSINNFCTVEMSALYFNILKDRLYTFAENSEARKSAQWTLHRIAHSLVRLIAPILPFTAEEIWNHLPKTELRKESSPHLTEFKHLGMGLSPEEADRWEKLFQIRKDVSKAIEIARENDLIGDSLEARVLIAASPKIKELLENFEDYLPAHFIVSEIELVDGVEDPTHTSELFKDLKVGIEKAGGEKCERCWNYSPAVGSFDEYPGICERCMNVIRVLSE